MVRRSNPYEEAIKRLLYVQRRPLSTRRIAVKTDMTWSTAKKHIFTLKKENILKPIPYKRGNLWCYNTDKKKKKGLL